ncbi:MAG: hypothetical protein ABTD50_19145 [Polyangiaceae bacterium]
MTTHIARWDLDKTYLRTDFDTLRALLRTALERAEEKQTHPGAATLLRETARAGVEVHILSGSPEPMRGSLERKLRMDGVVWETFTLKPSLRDLMRLRFRALRDQLGYKLAALFRARASLAGDSVRALGTETLVGDDSEADAFVYSLYADCLAGRVDENVLVDVLERGRVYRDVIRETMDAARRLVVVDAVERILIHLDRQTPPADFRRYGSRVVPFYNYLQAAFVLLEDGRLGAESVVLVAADLVVRHGFDGDALARSYLELARRGHLRGKQATLLRSAIGTWLEKPNPAAAAELAVLAERLPSMAERAQSDPDVLSVARPPPDYVAFVQAHNRRWRR